MANPVIPEQEPHGAQHKTLQLSNRQREILVLVAQGAPDSEIAHLLYLSRKTVGWYVGEILARLGARSRAHAVALALQQGILDCTGEDDRAP